MKLKDFLPIPILRIGLTKNKGMEITDEIFDEVSQTYNPLIHEAPIVREPHENADAGLRQKGRAQEALAWIKRLGVSKINGEKFLAITDAQASSPEHEAELVRLLSGPMKHNSPELDLASRLESEFYGKEHTGSWPEKARNKYYLRRVNLYGAHPIAQFGMPQAMLAELQLSESGDRFYAIKTNSEDKKMLHDKVYEKTKRFPNLPPHRQFAEAVKLILAEEGMPHSDFCKKFAEEEKDQSMSCPHCGNRLTLSKAGTSPVKEEIEAREKQLAETGMKPHRAFLQAVRETGRPTMQLAESYESAPRHRCLKCGRSK